MTVLGLDYSGGVPSGAAVARAGYGFVARYLANGLSGRANLTGAEVADMHANGVAVVLVWERKLLSGSDRATQGHDAGVADAQAALAQARAVSLPDNPIYFCIDFDAPDYSPAATSPRAKLGPIADYFDGVGSVLPHGRIGVYGGYWAVSRVLDAGLAAWAWQTAAWSGGREDPRIHLFQRVGTVSVDRVDCDIDEARQDQFGQQGVEDMASWDDMITADGLNDSAGKPVNDKARNVLWYANNKADHAEQNSAAALSAVQALTAKVDALTAAIAAQKPGTSGAIHVEGNLTVTTPEG